MSMLKTRSKILIKENRLEHQWDQELPRDKIFLNREILRKDILKDTLCRNHSSKNNKIENKEVIYSQVINCWIRNLDFYHLRRENLAKWILKCLIFLKLFQRLHKIDKFESSNHPVKVIGTQDLCKSNILSIVQ